MPKRHKSIYDLSKEEFAAYKLEVEQYYDSKYPENTVVRLDADYLDCKKGSKAVIRFVTLRDYRSLNETVVRKLHFESGRVITFCDDVDKICTVIDEEIETQDSKNESWFSKKKNG